MRVFAKRRTLGGGREEIAPGTSTLEDHRISSSELIFR
jgi:hypothetical protein